jgi:ElaB/YqjD/DUF883 family membrane-anchored ribosome-binding protein
MKAVVLGIMLAAVTPASAFADDKSTASATTTSNATSDGELKQRWQELKASFVRIGESIKGNAGDTKDDVKADLEKVGKQLDEVGKQLETEAKDGGKQVTKNVGKALDTIGGAISELGKRVEGAAGTAPKSEK